MTIINTTFLFEHSFMLNKVSHICAIHFKEAQDQEGGFFPLLQSSKMLTNMKIWYDHSNAISSAGISTKKTYLLHLPLHV